MAGDGRKKALREIASRILHGGMDAEGLERLKRGAAAKRSLAGGIRNSEILAAIRAQGTRHRTLDTLSRTAWPSPLLPSGP